MRPVVLSLGIVLSVATIATAAPGQVSVSDLRCEYRVDPLGIDMAAPRLSWVLESEQRGQRQTAYQILVAESEDALAQDQGTRWDSGTVVSDQTTQVTYGGVALKSRDRCYWKVRVWDGKGKPSDWSKPALWTMGLIEPGDWAGKWIGLDGEDKVDDLTGAKWIWYPEGEPEKSAPVAKRHFRRIIHLPADRGLREATAHIAADNRYILHVNGEKAGEGSSFKDGSGVDITKHLTVGPNVITVMAGNEGDADNPAGLIGMIRLTFPDGGEETIITDETWRVSDDADAGWRDASFDDSGWKPAKVLGEHGMDPWGSVVAGESRVLPARLVRREFKVTKPVRRATATLSGLGLFELHVNGGKVSDDVLVPALTEYTKRTLYLTYDVTSQIKDGANAVGVVLGNGRYYAPRINVPTFTRTFGYPKLMFDLLVEYEDGSTDRILSDGTWKLTTEGPIRENNEYDGSVYDARMEQAGWTEPGFDDSAWRAPQLVDAPEGALRAQMTPPIRVTETLKPISITEQEPGRYIVDMGQNMVGWCRFSVEGDAGTTVHLRHAETLDADGNLYVENLRSAKAAITYTLKGGGVEIYEPSFVFHGFRYVEVTGYPGKLTADNIAGRVVHDDLDPAGEFDASKPLLNQIYSNILWGVRGNYRSFPTDCPQRDERQAWLGDRSAECLGESYLFNIAPLYSKWHRDMREGQKESGSVSDVSPAYWPLYNDNVTWPSSIIIVPGMLYDQYGDQRVLEQGYDDMKRWIAHMNTYMEDGLIPRDSYGDWCVPPESQELIHSKDPARKTAGPLLGTAYFYLDLKLMARYAEILGRPADVADFNAQAEAMKQAFNKKFFNEKTAQYDNGTQTSSVLPLAFDLVPEGYRDRVFANLVKKIEEETDSHIGTGLIGGQWLMRTLSDNGRPDLAYTLATNTTYPSWGYMIEQGATTVWELWNGDTADPAMNSGNHVMLVGDLLIWFYQYLAGIKPEPQGRAFRDILIRPYVVGDLTHINASVNTAQGKIASHWRRSDDALELDVTIPTGSYANVSVPTLEWDAVEITEGGKPVWTGSAYKGGVPGVSAAVREDGWVTFKVASGSYRFRCVPED